MAALRGPDWLRDSWPHTGSTKAITHISQAGAVPHQTLSLSAAEQCAGRQCHPRPRHPQELPPGVAAAAAAAATTQHDPTRPEPRPSSLLAWRCCRRRCLDPLWLTPRLAVTYKYDLRNYQTSCRHLSSSECVARPGADRHTHRGAARLSLTHPALNKARLAQQLGSQCQQI